MNSMTDPGPGSKARLPELYHARDVLYRSQRFSFLDIFLGFSSRNVVLLCEF